MEQKLERIADLIGGWCFENPITAGLILVLFLFFMSIMWGIDSASRK